MQSSLTRRGMLRICSLRHAGHSVEDRAVEDGAVEDGASGMNMPGLSRGLRAASEPPLHAPPGVASYRSVFISDTHLGTRGCRSDFLADFLRRTSCQHLFLVGDIVDGWRLRKSWYWDETHDEVIRQILRKARSGTDVTYIPGNHDEMFRAWLPLNLEVAGVRLRGEAVHVTADGKRLLVIHGDEFDSVVRYAKFIALLGASAYTAALAANRWFNAMRRRLGYPYWSLSAWLKRRVKEAVKAIARFEHHDGRLELIDWAALNRFSFLVPRNARLSEPV